MDKKLADVLLKIGDEFRDEISMGSRFYLEVDIGKQAQNAVITNLRKNIAIHSPLCR